MSYITARCRVVHSFVSFQSSCCSDLGSISTLDPEIVDTEKNFLVSAKDFLPTGAGVEFSSYKINFILKGL